MHLLWLYSAVLKEIHVGHEGIIQVPLWPTPAVHRGCILHCFKLTTLNKRAYSGYCIPVPRCEVYMYARLPGVKPTDVPA